MTKETAMTAMTATTMDAVRERMLGLGFTEKSSDPDNQYFIKKLRLGDVDRFATPFKEAFWDVADDEMLCTVDIVPAGGIVQLYVADCDMVEEFPIGSEDAEELLRLAGAASEADE